MVAPVLSHFELCSLRYDTFEKLMMIKLVKSVNNLKIADQAKYEVPDNFHFTVSYYVACSSSIKYAVRPDV